MKTQLNIARRRTVRLARRGFTLIEILAVIGILGILMALVASSVPTAYRKVNQASAKSKLRDIVSTALSYGKPIASSGTRAPKAGKTVAGYAEILYGAGLREAKVWYLRGDKYATDSEIPETVLLNDTNQMTSVKPSGWAVVFDVKKKAAEQGTDHPYPLAWTRGLDDSGAWTDQKGAWGKEGGHVGFNSGTVEWYSDLKGDDGKGVLFKYGKDEQTSSYTQATNAQDATEDAVSSQ